MNNFHSAIGADVQACSRCAASLAKPRAAGGAGLASPIGRAHVALTRLRSGALVRWRFPVPEPPQAHRRARFSAEKGDDHVVTHGGQERRTSVPRGRAQSGPGRFSRDCGDPDEDPTVLRGIGRPLHDGTMQPQGLVHWRHLTQLWAERIASAIAGQGQERSSALVPTSVHTQACLSVGA